MLLVSILLLLKTYLFINITGVVHKPFLVYLFSAGISILIIFLLDFFNEKRKSTYLGIFYTIISLIMFVDVVYFSFFNTLPSIKMFSMMKMLPNVSNSVKSLITLQNLLFILDIPFVFLYLKKKGVQSFLSNKQKFIFSASIMVVLISSTIYLNSKNLLNTLKYQELFSYHANDIVKYLREDEASASTQGLEIMSEETLNLLKSRSESLEGPTTGIGKDKNLIVIQVEALQSFVINLNYNNQIITPNLNKLIQDKGSLYYNNYFQLLGRGNTSDAEFVSNNSLHPSMETPTYTQYQDNTFYGLPWVLRDNGYTAWAFHGYEKNFWNRDKAYKNQGFQRFLSEDDYEVGEIIELGLNDKDFFDQSIAYLKELDNKDENPFYAFMVTLSSHNPFTMPEHYKVLDILPEHKNTLLGDYLQSIHYADKCIGEFLENLKKEGLYDTSVIALYGDHFAIPNSSDETIIMMNKFLGREYNFDDIMNIPLIITIPGFEEGRTVSKAGSQLDFFPTILNILGLKNEKGIMFGYDLNNYKGYTNVTSQTITRKGSFIDEDTLFVMATTEIFEDSRAINRKTKEPVDIHRFREIYDNGIKEINISDYILKTDYIKTILEEGENNESVQKETDDFSKYAISKLNTNCMEELDKCYKRGVKLIALEIGTDDENSMVLMDKDRTSIDYLNFYIDEYKDLTLLFRMQEHNEDFYNRLRNVIPRSKSDFVVEINNFDDYYFIKSYGFENILFNNSISKYGETEILDFLNAHRIYGIIIDPEDLNKDLQSKIEKSGTPIYFELKNSIQLYR